MAYDSAAGPAGPFRRLRTHRLPDDTWSWTGTAWTQPRPRATSPPARGYATLAYDPATSQMVLFGGYGTTYDNDTWVWDGSNWDLQSPGTSPAARDGATMAYDSATGQMLLFGGFNGSTLNENDTWNWTGSTWAQLAPATSPPVRYRAGHGLRRRHQPDGLVRGGDAGAPGSPTPG